MGDTCLKKPSPSITKYHQLFDSNSYMFAAIYSFYIRSLVSMLHAIYFAGEQFSSTPGCTDFVHPHVHGL